MRAKAKEKMVKKIKKASSQLSVSNHKSEDADFLPLEGGPGQKLPDQEAPFNHNARVLYVGRIPHGFYEKEMDGFFKQFGTIKRLRISRNKKTGKSKHFGFIEFESPEVAKIVADSMHNYLVFEHMLQVYLVPPERVHPKLWKGANRVYKPLNWTRIQIKRHNKERTLEEHKKLVEGILKRNKKRQKKIEAAGIEYECPEIVASREYSCLDKVWPGFHMFAFVQLGSDAFFAIYVCGISLGKMGSILPASKKIKFDDGESE